MFQLLSQLTDEKTETWLGKASGRAGARSGILAGVFILKPRTQRAASTVVLREAAGAIQVP